MRSNVFAYTATGSNYPEYISVNKEESGDLSFTVRSSVKEDGKCGDTAVATLSKKEVQELMHSLFSFILPKKNEEAQQ